MRKSVIGWKPDVPSPMSTTPCLLLFLLALLGAPIVGAEPAATPTPLDLLQGESRPSGEAVTALEKLHQDLELTAAQEWDWVAWTTRVGEEKTEMRKAAPNFERLKRMSVPDRMQALIAINQVRVASMEKILVATRDFHEELEPEQQAVFDAIWAPTTLVPMKAPKPQSGGGWNISLARQVQMAGGVAVLALLVLGWWRYGRRRRRHRHHRRTA